MTRQATVTVLLVLSTLLAACSGDGGGGDGGGPVDEAAPSTTTSASGGGPSTTTDADGDARTYVLAPDGDDAGEGTEPDPWRTLDHALPRLRPGDELRLRGGTYRERVRDLDLQPGTPDARITIRAWPGEEPVLAGLLWLDRPSYWTVSGLHVTWDDDGKAGKKDHMVKVTDGVGWRIEGNELSNAKSFAALLVASSGGDEPADWSVTGNCIHGTRKANGTNQDHLVYVNTGTTGGPGLVSGNLLFDAPNGAGVKLGGADDEDEGVRRVTVERNTIWKAAQSVLIAWRSEDNEVADNLLGATTRRYAAIRGYRLSGEGNVARGNVAAETQDVLLNDDGHEEVEDAGGNVLLTRSPGFDDTKSCDGFRPSDARAARAGHLSGQGATG